MFRIDETWANGESETARDGSEDEEIRLRSLDRVPRTLICDNQIAKNASLV